jgi:DNA-binding response OmpR family regulator
VNLATATIFLPNDELRGVMINTQQRKKAILCIEDDQDTCEMLTVLLGLAGYDVTHAQNSIDGLSLARQSKFDLILLDWYLPDGTGIELCQGIREFDTTTPIVFYTGEAHETELQQALSAGANGYLIKPVDVDKLLEVVAKYTGLDSVVS